MSSHDNHTADREVLFRDGPLAGCKLVGETVPLPVVLTVFESVTTDENGSVQFRGGTPVIYEVVEVLRCGDCLKTKSHTLALADTETGPEMLKGLLEEPARDA